MRPLNWFPDPPIICILQFKEWRFWAVLVSIWFDCQLFWKMLPLELGFIRIWVVTIPSCKSNTGVGRAPELRHRVWRGFGAWVPASVSCSWPCRRVASLQLVLQLRVRNPQEWWTPLICGCHFILWFIDVFPSSLGTLWRTVSEWSLLYLCPQVQVQLPTHQQAKHKGMADWD